MRPLYKVCLMGAIALLAVSGGYLTAQDKRSNTAPAGQATPRPGPGRDEPDLRGDHNADTAIKAASSRAVLAYLRSPGPRTLKTALETCLAARKKISNDLLNDFLTAFCYHEADDAAGEARTLSNYTPEKKDMYRFIFYEHRAELADSLYLLPAYTCRRLRESARAVELFPPGARCPCFGGPISVKKFGSGKRTLSRFICPKCDSMLGLQGKKLAGNELLRVKNNTLNSILVMVECFHEDRHRSLPDTRNSGSNFLELFGVKEGQVLADIGCGIGEYTFPLARMVGPRGKVYAEDIDANAIGLIKYCVEKGGIKNIEPVLGGATDTGLLPGVLDMAVLMNVYRGMEQELDAGGQGAKDAFLDSFFSGIRKTLKKDGVLVITDSLNPAFDVSVEKVTEELGKRRFRLVSDKSDTRKRRLILLFKIAESDAKRSPPGLNIENYIL